MTKNRFRRDYAGSIFFMLLFIQCALNSTIHSHYEATGSFLYDMIVVFICATILPLLWVKKRREYLDEASVGYYSVQLLLSTLCAVAIASNIYHITILNLF